MNAMFCPTPKELRAAIQANVEDRDLAALICDRAAHAKADARIEELKRMLPERQFEPYQSDVRGDPRCQFEKVSA